MERYKREVEPLFNELMRLHQERGEEIARLAEASGSAGNPDAAARHQRNVSDLESRIAQQQAHYDEAQKAYNEFAEREGERLMEEGEQAKRDFKAMQEKLARHDALHQETRSAIQALLPPKQITVLFLAANPLDQQQLRLDEEVRSIAEMIRKSEHRDAVRLESRWAVRARDVLQAINECEPRIVHFVGHGSDKDEIVFQDSSGRAKPVSKEAIVQAMATGSDEIQLVFFNTCYSRGQAEAVVKHVPAAIGMNTSIGDEAARVFSAQFYSALGFGRSLERAFQQARAALGLEGIAEESTPELFVAEGLSAKELVLVQPDDAE